MISEKPVSYSMEFRVRDNVLFMPLWVQRASPERRMLYHSRVCGVRIESIEADGVLIRGSDHDFDYDDFDMGTFEAPNEWHGYQVEMWLTDDDKAYCLIAMRWMTEDDSDLEEYSIPSKDNSVGDPLPSSVSA